MQSFLERAPVDHRAAARFRPETVEMRPELFEEFIRISLETLPHKAYGLVGGRDLHRPRSLYACSTNLRNTPEWRELFASFGEFYTDPDRGFVITPGEYRDVMKTMKARGESFIGVFHSHRCRCAEPSEVDTAFHFDSDLLYYIVSVVEPEKPEVRIFRLFETHYEEIPFQLL